MATTYDFKIKTTDGSDTSYTRTFTSIVSTSANDLKELGNSYAALTNYTTKTAKLITNTDVDLSE